MLIKSFKLQKWSQWREISKQRVDVAVKNTTAICHMVCAIYHTNASDTYVVRVSYKFDCVVLIYSCKMLPSHLLALKKGEVAQGVFYYLVYKAWSNKAEIPCTEDHHKMVIKMDAENKAHPQVRYECARKKNITLRT